MSAYIVTDETLSKLASFISTWTKGPNGDIPHAYQSTMPWHDTRELTQALLDLNASGVDARYGAGESSQFRTVSTAPYVPAGHVHRLAAHALFGEYLYQCMEGDVPETPEYKAIEWIYNTIAHQIACGQVEAQEARIEAAKSEHKEALARNEANDAARRLGLDEPPIGSSDRTAVTKYIRTALKKRSGKQWACKGSTGTAYNWLTIYVPRVRENEEGFMTKDDRAELAELLGLESVHMQGVSVMSNDWDAHIKRSLGLKDVRHEKTFWD